MVNRVDCDSQKLERREKVHFLDINKIYRHLPTSFLSDIFIIELGSVLLFSVYVMEDQATFMMTEMSKKDKGHNLIFIQ